MEKVTKWIESNKYMDFIKNENGFTRVIFCVTVFDTHKEITKYTKKLSYGGFKIAKTFQVGVDVEYPYE